MSNQSSYKSPVRKLVKFFEQSRDQWKEKHQTTKKTNKYLKNRIRTLQASKAKWREEALDLRKQLKKIANQQEKEVSCSTSLKKSASA
ncbi:MAG: hypothetical protein KAG86_07690 [Gammaproteobacteria bacterium]|nr:hypothetical protein [Gammaproteobacteria bacterium]